MAIGEVSEVDTSSLDLMNKVTAAQSAAQVAVSQGDTSAGATQMANNGPTLSFANFLPNLGNFTLVAVGIVLAVGALLISQKQTIVKVANTASDVASKGVVGTILA